MPLHTPDRPTRRQFLAASAATGLTATAGCLGDGVADPDASSSVSMGVTVPPDREPSAVKWYLSPAELAVFVERQREWFGEAAPWDVDEPVRNDGEFVGAWALTPTVGGDDDPLGLLTILCLTRRIERGDDDRLRHLCWAGGRRLRSTRPVVGDLGPELALADLAVGLTTRDGPLDLLAVAPADVGEATDDGTLFVATQSRPGLEQPTPPGEVAVERDDGGRYLLRWRGNRTAPTALTAICETSVPGGNARLDFAVDAGLGLAGRGPL
ncbi:twin-arginine translocation signal domain-containing protein [Salinirubrum litoreum]|uniref:Twin-arginine translocation signal domain-containing protein n=1 Tax=Salinirubrum litoreum TaxID=1126234 RepID=A0ABD5RBG9_9EURY|nr:twin-arginine translocation signal domain-containing protein [Salinirubrum litoreum]